MIVAQPEQQHLSLFFLEGALVLLAVLLPFAAPRLGSGLFLPIERAFRRLAHRRGLAVLVVGLTELLLRLAILPILPIPKPFIPDDFSFLLSADTFAHGRLANPTPALWQHFESLQISLIPTYGSMYFPADGLVLALGQVTVGIPWLGLLLFTAFAAAALCWMLQAWLPPTWALLGGFLFVLRLGLFSYWINPYTGAGMIAVLGGALVLGAFPRLKRHLRHRDALWLAIGIILLILSRPYEGVLLCLPVLVALLLWIFRGKRRPTTAALARTAAVPLLLIVACIAWLGYFDARNFGSPTTLPYTLNRAQYAYVPYYIWQKPRPEPTYRFPEIRGFYEKYEMGVIKNVWTPSGLAEITLTKGLRSFLFFAAIALWPPLIFSMRVLKDRRTRFLIVALAVFAIGMAIEIFLVPHYMAVFTAVFYALGLQAMRHMRVWQAGGQPTGILIVRLLVIACIVMVGLRLAARPLGVQISEWPSNTWAGTWIGPGNFGQERAAIAAQLAAMPGRQIAIVHYEPGHEPTREWVYNGADLEGTNVLWAREMTPAENQQLIDHYSGRTVWLVEPDTTPVRLTPYTGSPSVTVPAR